MLTDEDNFNALAATTLAGDSDTPVYWLAPSHGVVAPYIPGETLFSPTLTHPALTARYAAGARVTTQSADGEVPPAIDLLFLINPEGTLLPVTTSRPQDPQPGDTLVVLTPGGNGAPQLNRHVARIPEQADGTGAEHASGRPVPLVPFLWSGPTACRGQRVPV